MPAPIVIVLAAGHGTRMHSKVPKVLHDLCGRPLALWPVHAALEAGAGKVVVVGGPDRALEPVLPEGVVLAVQPEANGTGGAVQAAAEHVSPQDDTVIVVNGDVPLIDADTIRALAEAHAFAGEEGAQATVATMVLDDPTGYGRVVRRADGDLDRIVETKSPGDATPEELEVREVNAGVYAFAGGPLLEALNDLRPDNAQGELYLTDALTALPRVAVHTVDDPNLGLGVNDRTQLAQARAIAQERIVRAHEREGVTFVNRDSVVVDVGVRLGADTVVEPSTVLRGATVAGEGCRIGPNSTLTDARLGDGVTVLHAYVVDSEVRDGVTIGPFAYLRPGTLVREGAKIGTFVELKNSDIGEGTKVPHLSYLGDADVGPRTNIGAANVTANYDGVSKHRTRIGAGVKSSVDTTFVAPVTVGDNAWTGAGAVVKEDVPEGALAVGVPARIIEGYDAERKRRSGA